MHGAVVLRPRMIRDGRHRSDAARFAGAGLHFDAEGPEGLKDRKAANPSCKSGGGDGWIGVASHRLRQGMLTPTQCIEDRNEHDDAGEHGIKLPEPGEDKAKSLQSPEQPFYLVVPALHLQIICPRMESGSGWRNHWPEP